MADLTLSVGDLAATRYNGRRQVVLLTAMRRERNCDSGFMFQVQPMLRTWRDHSNPHDDWPGCWYDAGWFTKEPLHQMVVDVIVRTNRKRGGNSMTIKMRKVEHILTAAFDDDPSKHPIDGEFEIQRSIDNKPSNMIVVCPGCHNILSLPIRSAEQVGGVVGSPSWAWDGNESEPTLQPSVNHVGCWHGWIKAGVMTQQA